VSSIRRRPHRVSVWAKEVRHSEYSAVTPSKWPFPTSNVVRSPAELDDAEAVSLLVNYNTMYFALAHRAALRPGDTGAGAGASGGVGTAAVQIAKAMGASKVIAVVHREEAC